MFLSVHDLHLLAVMLAVAAGLSVVFAVGITRSLRDDLAALRRTTDRVAAGDLAARSGVTRADELGATAAALDADDRTARRRRGAARAATTTPAGRCSPPSATTCAPRCPRCKPPSKPSRTAWPTDRPRYLRSMSHDIAHLRALVDDLFLLARIEAGDLTVDHDTVDLAELADETIEAMAPGRQRPTTSSCGSRPPDACPCAADPKRSAG